MHFQVPKPLHGWREFAGEVGIIVVGVLIALAAAIGLKPIWNDFPPYDPSICNPVLSTHTGAAG